MKTIIRIDQMSLIAAISCELENQFPVVTVNPDQFNAIIAAANSIKAAYDGTEVEMGDEEDE